LVQALHCGREGAREQLWHWVREPLASLLDKFIVHHGLAHSRDVLIGHALHAVEIYLRTRPPDEFAQLSPQAFRGAILVHVAKLVWQPFGGRVPQAPDPLPDAEAYASQSLFLPLDEVGGYRFGGDWFGGARGRDGSLWVMVADVTGHGYCVYLLASHLPDAWRVAWEGVSPDWCQPTDLLQSLHSLLEACLPEGVYVEACLGQFHPSGMVTLASAGGTRLLVRHGGCITLRTVRGAWLGLCRPNPADQARWSLDAGDETLLASDGLFDQFAASPRASAVVTDLLARGPMGKTLWEQVQHVLTEALREHPQRDDITIVGLQRAATVQISCPDSSVIDGEDS
jgi:hypothetical protein